MKSSYAIITLLSLSTFLTFKYYSLSKEAKMLEVDIDNWVASAQEIEQALDDRNDELTKCNNNKAECEKRVTDAVGAKTACEESKLSAQEEQNTKLNELQKLVETKDQEATEARQLADVKAREAQDERANKDAALADAQNRINEKDARIQQLEQEIQHLHQQQQQQQAAPPQQQEQAPPPPQ